MEEETKHPPPFVQACATRLADFWDTNPHAWLAFAESHFRRAGIRNELAKFYAVLESLPMSIISRLTDLIINPPEKEPYAKLCSELIRIASLSVRERCQALMQQLEVGDSKPSEVYQRMKQLLENENIDALFFRQMFLQKLPPIIQQLIDISCPPDTALDELVAKADEAYESTSNNRAISSCNPPQASLSNAALSDYQWIANQISALRKQLAEIEIRLECGRSRERCKSRPRRQSASPRRQYKRATEDTCFYHGKFGAAARKCQPPCKFWGNHSARQ